MFELDPRLREACFECGRLSLSRLLLMNNAAVPWFLLVPETSKTEIVDLEPDEQAILLREINQVAGFVRGFDKVVKLNVAAIGNKVEQLHIHVIGRHPGDYCWPGVVWGQPSEERYTEEQVQAIKIDLSNRLDECFSP